MAISEMNYTGGGGSGVIVTETIPNDGNSHTYEYTITSCATVIFKYNTTFNYIGLFVKNGTDEIIKSISDVTVTKSGNKITIVVSSNMWGNTMYVLHD